ncbi:helix-turn-helix domain-containing protein [Streptomyces ossamyceticus]|uniref:helix-turn-helix domain-containing protein n=1 Tax=Streptomyces ossamyceticus TaxID=249581 RepID=UPI003EB83F21
MASSGDRRQLRPSAHRPEERPDVGDQRLRRLQTHREHDRSGAELAEHLGVSRRTLRRDIEPKPAAATAPQHGKAAQ